MIWDSFLTKDLKWLTEGPVVLWFILPLFVLLFKNHSPISRIDDGENSKRTGFKVYVSERCSLKIEHILCMPEAWIQSLLPNIFFFLIK